MRLRLLGIVALTLTFGCVREGYDPRPKPSDPKSDASHGDGGSDSGHDAAANALDASARDASAPDSAIGALDATVPDDGAMQGSDDGAMQGSGDGAAGDGGDDGGAVDLCPERSDALFCDGFEDPSFSRWAYTVLDNGTLDRTTERFHSGAGALRATTGAASPINRARYGGKAFDHQKSGEIWVRYYYYLPSSVEVDPAFSTAVVTEIEPPYFGFSLLVLPSRVAIGTLGTKYQGTMAFPRDRWTCVELHIEIDAAAGVYEAYLDGALAARSPAMDTLPDQGYTSIDLGIHYTDPAQGPVEAYVDDVVAGNTRLGCD